MSDWDWTNMSNSRTLSPSPPEEEGYIAERDMTSHYSTITDGSKATTNLPAPPKNGFKGDVENNNADESTSNN